MKIHVIIVKYSASRAKRALDAVPSRLTTKAKARAVVGWKPEYRGKNGITPIAAVIG